MGAPMSDEMRGVSLRFSIGSRSRLVDSKAGRQHGRQDKSEKARRIIWALCVVHAHGRVVLRDGAECNALDRRAQFVRRCSRAGKQSRCLHYAAAQLGCCLAGGTTGGLSRNGRGVGQRFSWWMHWTHVCHLVPGRVRLRVRGVSTDVGADGELDGCSRARVCLINGAASQHSVRDRNVRRMRNGVVADGGGIALTPDTETPKSAVEGVCG